jgi:transcriptional regulator with XRE-family HTH domain
MPMRARVSTHRITCNPCSQLQLNCMATNFSVFSERLYEACRARGTTENLLCSSIGDGTCRAIELYVSGVMTLDIERLCQIADRLDVSTDWLLGRTDVMELPKEKGKPVQAAIRGSEI